MIRALLRSSNRSRMVHERASSYDSPGSKRIDCSTADKYAPDKSIVIYERVGVACPKRLMFLHGQVRSSAKNRAAFPLYRRLSAYHTPHTTIDGPHYWHAGLFRARGVFCAEVYLSAQAEPADYSTLLSDCQPHHASYYLSYL
jgi:hypothetical protein